MTLLIYNTAVPFLCGVLVTRPPNSLATEAYRAYLSETVFMPLTMFFAALGLLAGIFTVKFLLRAFRPYRDILHQISQSARNFLSRLQSSIVSLWPRSRPRSGRSQTRVMVNHNQHVASSPPQVVGAPALQQQSAMTDNLLMYICGGILAAAAGFSCPPRVMDLLSKPRTNLLAQALLEYACAAMSLSAAYAISEDWLKKPFFNHNPARLHWHRIGLEWVNFISGLLGRIFLPTVGSIFIRGFGTSSDTSELDLGLVSASNRTSSPPSSSSSSGLFFAFSSVIRSLLPYFSSRAS